MKDRLGENGRVCGFCDGWPSREFSGHEGQITGVSISSDSQWAMAAGEDGTLKCWRLSTGQCMRTLKGHTEQLKSVAITPDGNWALSANDKEIILWELSSGRRARTFRWNEGVLYVADPDDKEKQRIEPDALEKSGLEATEKAKLAIEQRFTRVFKGVLDAMPGGMKDILGNKANAMSSIFEAPIFRNQVRSVYISSDGRLGLVEAIWPPPRDLTKGSSHGALLWELSTGKCRRKFEGRMGPLAMSPNGRWMLSVSKDRMTLKLWELSTGMCVGIFEGHKGNVDSVRFGLDGRSGLSGSSDKTLKLWELYTGKCLRTFEGHTGPVWCVALGPDGRWALSGSSDNTVKLWELSTGKCVRTFKGHTNKVTSVAISPDGRWVLSASKDKTLKLWELVWHYEFPEPADWDEGARPYLETFLALHCPVGEDGMSRIGKPKWDDGDFKRLLKEIQYRGFGWLRPQGVQKKLEEMTANWQGPPPLTGID